MSTVEKIALVGALLVALDFWVGEFKGKGIFRRQTR
jgi:hypothetical protein